MPRPLLSKSTREQTSPYIETLRCLIKHFDSSDGGMKPLKFYWY